MKFTIFAFKLHALNLLAVYPNMVADHVIMTAWPIYYGQY